MQPLEDQLHRFLFEDLHARGELVQLSETIASIVEPHQYPAGVEQLLSELVIVTSLLTATLKIEGEIAVQLQGDGPAKYLAVNANQDQVLKGVAKVADGCTQTGLKGIVGEGNMIITIRPSKGEPYQGIVKLEHDTLAECIAHYFETSEQIPTRIWLYTDTDNHKAGGALIQLLPDSGEKEQQLEDYEHLCQLTNTLKAEEVFTLDVQTILYRLYHEETVRLFDPQKVRYKCSCSEEKCLTAISQLGSEEITSILKEQGNISITCDFCMTTYSFDEAKLVSLLNRH